MNIIDDAISLSLLSSIKNHIESHTFPWYYIKTTANERNQGDELDYSFYHMAMEDGEMQSGCFDISNTIALILKDRFLMDENWTVHRLRWGMLTGINQPWKNQPHTDMPDRHMVILFYLDDSDGDTYFYDKDHNIVDSISPKQNRAVLFDGATIHSSSKPTKFGRRIALNINYINLKEK